MVDDNRKAFDASKYLTKLKNKDYLEVKWRLLWLRTEHRDASINTELTHLGDGMAVFKAVVTIPDGGSSTGWGSETTQDFGDYIEKAETKAIGRALAALGYGTQFCEDHDFGTAEHGRPVDHAGSKRESSKPASQPIDPASPALATPAQVKAIYLIAHQQYDRTDLELEELVKARVGRLPTQLTVKEASIFINEIKTADPWAAEPTASTQGEKALTRDELLNKIARDRIVAEITKEQLDRVAKRDKGLDHYYDGTDEYLKEVSDNVAQKRKEKEEAGRG